MIEDMDEMIESRPFAHYVPPSGCASPRLSMSALGHHERMSPGIIRHGGKGFGWLLMCFHSPASVRCGAALQPAENAVILWDPDAPHEYGNAAREWDHSWLIVDGTLPAALLRRHPLELNRLLHCGGEEVCEHYWTCFERELRQPEPDNWVLSTLLELLFAELSRRSQGRSPSLPEGIARAVEYMHAHPASRLTLRELAELAGWSVPRFQVLFRAAYGESPMRYWRELRLQLAHRLLRFGLGSVKETAQRCGFDDPLFFSRAFRARFGAAPSEWKREKENRPCRQKTRCLFFTGACTRSTGRRSGGRAGADGAGRSSPGRC